MGVLSRMGAMISAASFLAVLPTLAPPALAASVVVYGDREVVVISMPVLIDALQSALEQCSRNDRNCRVLQRCPLPGAGAVAVARGAAGIIDSIGSACGQLDIDNAMKTANGYCARNISRIGACSSHHTWQD